MMETLTMFQSSTYHFKQRLISSNDAQSTEYDRNCYAISSAWDNSYYRQNNYSDRNHNQTMTDELRGRTTKPWLSNKKQICCFC